MEYSEHFVQSGIVAGLRALQRAGVKFEFAGDAGGMTAASKAAAARMKQAGLQSGEPDLRIYLPGGRLLLIELKRRTGRRSEAQIRRHAALEALGHRIETLVALDPAEGAAEVAKLLWVELGSLGDLSVGQGIRVAVDAAENLMALSKKVRKAA